MISNNAEPPIIIYNFVLSPSSSSIIPNKYYRKSENIFFSYLPML